ncbi:DUF192 domain-containing protein [Pseudomonas protegens]|uniref:DUF192 domain-containing protein n=1 Tax=Pseudomonas protegens TaxID=380021 RepID=UPI0023ECE07D|nr:DUF192 domain-containing protein [Pseudomonas protegens]MDF4211137.1 DUF192 domain-containing protein [Pseudomonas protegens]
MLVKLWPKVATAALLVGSVSATIIHFVKNDQNSKPATVCNLTFNEITLENVPQVKTQSQMERGLSGLDDVGTGMLFTWSDDAPRVFWMKGTPTPLSVAFIDSTGTVLQIEDMEPQTEFLHWSTLPVREGLEVKRGDFQQLGITPGSRLIKRECVPIAEHQLQGRGA